MKTIRDPRQQELFNEFAGMISKRGWRHIERGWQGVMRHVILKELPARRLGDDLCDDIGRPSAELYSMAGLLLIREMNNWTVPETVEALMFRTDVQYALNMRPGSDVSQRTIERYIARLYSDRQLANDIFCLVANTLIEELELSIKKQRLDSTHVLSDMAVLGRTRMMGIATKRFLAQVRKRHDEKYRLLPKSFRDRYEQQASQVFANKQCAASPQKSRQQAAEDLRYVIHYFKDHEAISSWKSYQHLKLIFQQQCEEIGGKVTVKKATGGDVLQNPSDPDATYCGNKGAGYQAQLAETCDDKNAVELIVGAKVETAVQSDADAVEPMLEDLQARNQLPTELVADCGYGGGDNVQHAETMGVQLISPVPGGKEFDEEQVGPEHFEMNEETHVVTACPQQHAPLKSHYNRKSDRIAITMDASICSQCPLLDRCPVKLKKSRGGKLSAKFYFKMPNRRARQRRCHEQTTEFKDKYRIRSGIEATNSSLKRRLGLKRLRVRGSPAVTATVLLKLAGWNVLRAAAAGTLRSLPQILADIAWRLRALRKMAALCCSLKRLKRLPKPIQPFHSPTPFEIVL